jgi:hypothetical protein
LKFSENHKGEKILWLGTVQDHWNSTNVETNDGEYILGLVMSYFMQGRGGGESYFKDPEDLFSELKNFHWNLR